MTESIELRSRINIAYKKLKANVYFDKTQLPLRNQIVEFEDSRIDVKLDALYEALSGSEETWAEYESDIIDMVSTYLFPKKLKDCECNDNSIIFNTDSVPVQLEKAQYFIDLSVEGHILGVLWVLSFGIMLDDEKNAEGMYEHSYGNRLRKGLVNPDTDDITYSPSLFEPYFSQYESWRDRALGYAKRNLEDKQDALIITLDFKSFFYSVDIQIAEYEKLLEKVSSHKTWHERVHAFVYHVLRRYSDVLKETSKDEDLRIGDRTILPIGFLPSYILSNWVLKPFDDAIVKRWNPIYYGRYVDDIIIVDKVEKNSPLHKEAREVDRSGSLENVLTKQRGMVMNVSEGFVKT